MEHRHLKRGSYLLLSDCIEERYNMVVVSRLINDIKVFLKNVFPNLERASAKTYSSGSFLLALISNVP